MESKLLKDFLSEQVKLLQAPSHAKPAHKSIVRPDKVVAVAPDDIESQYNHIIEKKPAGKKVIKFLQNCIDEILANED